MSDLIPNGERLLKNNFNVLLVGLHGTGKTTAMKDLAAKAGLRFKYFSCSTLDPYTDLVGVPIPEKDEKGKSHLEMVRPRVIDEAQLVFFDEFNRADRQTMNAIFEIIQFRSINGEPLPNLRACWAAMNPPEGEYQVNDVDPALIDRFDVFLDITPQISVPYMGKFMSLRTAQALKVWWEEHGHFKKDAKGKISYISPRRLQKMGMVWEATKSRVTLAATLPIGGKFDIQKLYALLEAPQRKAPTNIGSAPISLTYTRQGIFNQRAKIAIDLAKNPRALETHRSVAQALKQGVGSRELVHNYAEVLNALTPSVLESLITSFSSSKVSQMRSAMRERLRNDRRRVYKLKTLHKQLSRGAAKDYGFAL